MNGLHSVELKAHTNSFFLLTQKIDSVKHNCSLTVSEVFPVGAASGGQAKSPSADWFKRHVIDFGQPISRSVKGSSKMTEGGLARLYSKVLVEENKKPSQRQDRVPKALN